MAEFINDYANGVGMGLIFLGTIAAGHFFRRRKLKETGIAFTVAGLWGSLLWSTGRFIFAEQRPMQGGHMRFFTGDGHGFSGHAAVAAVLVLPIRDVLLRDRSPAVRNAVTAAAIIWVGLVGWSRVYLGMHFVWNILAGGSVGMLAGAATVATWKELHGRAPVTPVLVE